MVKSSNKSKASSSDSDLVDFSNVEKKERIREKSQRNRKLKDPFDEKKIDQVASGYFNAFKEDVPLKLAKVIINF